MSNRTCDEHVTDSWLKDAITRDGVTGLPCDYCGRDAMTVEIWEIAEHLDHLIERFYEPTSGYDDWGSPIEDPSGESLVQIISVETGANASLLNDLTECLGDIWFDQDSTEHKYGEEPHFVDSSRFGDALAKEWSEMEESLRYDGRIVNPMAYKILQRVFGYLSSDEISNNGSSGVIVDAGPGTYVAKVYRARVFSSQDELEQAMQYPENSIGPPPLGTGASGRMNASGVSVFYGSINPEVAIAEVRPPVGSSVVVAGFNIAIRIRLLDITRLGPVLLTGSKFDRETFERYERSAFLENLKDRLVMPVMPGSENEGYLITQAVADYLSMNEELNLDGIMFPSVQHEQTQVVGSNIILFRKASNVADAMRPKVGWSSFNLWELDDMHEGRYEYAPSLTTKIVGSSSKEWRSMKRSFPDVLALDRDDITLHLVKGVRFSTEESQVRHIQIEDESPLST